MIDDAAQRAALWQPVSQAIKDLNDAMRMAGVHHPVTIVLHPKDRVAASQIVPFDVRAVAARQWPEFQWDGVTVTYQDVFLERAL